MGTSFLPIAYYPPLVLRLFLRLSSTHLSSALLFFAFVSSFVILFHRAALNAPMVILVVAFGFRMRDALRI
jgi:hypothetical protein